MCRRCPSTAAATEAGEPSLPRAPKLCAYPTCGEIVPNGQRHCRDHKREPWKTAAPTASASAINRPGWKKLRAAVLKRDRHQCQIRGSRCTTIATQVDHVVEVADGGTDDMSNLQSCCTPCHLTKTGKDARARQLRPR